MATARLAATPGSEVRSRAAATSAAIQPTSRLVVHDARRATHPNATTNTLSVSSPSSVELAARAVNSAPRSCASISSTANAIAGNALTSPPSR